MILIADSGSTKTEWKSVDNGIPGKSYISSGINPFFLSGEEIVRLLKKEMAEIECIPVSQVFYYGTGCSNPAKINIIKGALSQFFSNAELSVGSDLLGAARSLCQNEPGIACIIGTGSNSCYYDGNTIVSNVSPLGYILGDEGGGAVLGRKLVSGVLKKQLPGIVIENFFKAYNFTPAEIHEMMCAMRKEPILLTSVRRSITDLTKENRLIKCQWSESKEGKYGKLNRVWRYNSEYIRPLNPKP